MKLFGVLTGLLLLFFKKRIICAISVKYYKVFLAHSYINEEAGVYNYKWFSSGIQNSLY